MGRASMFSFALLASVLLVSALRATPARAGDRPLSVLLVNMTPDPVSDEGRACSAFFRRQFRIDDQQYHVRAMGETAFREATNLEGDFMSLDPAAVARFHEGEDWVDAIVLFDCRPETQFRAWVSPANGGIARIEWRAPLDANARRLMFDRFTTHAWVGFVP